MKRLNLSMLVMAMLFSSSLAISQGQGNRPSPPAKVEAKINGLTVLVDYSRPSKNGRTIFGELEPYGKVWRTGANETTWIEFSGDVMINGQALAKGRYALFTIPQKDQWTVIFNKKWKDWGAYAYDQSQDVLRIEVAADNDAPVTEMFTIAISEQGELSMAWDNTKVAFNIKKG